MKNTIHTKILRTIKHLASFKWRLPAIATLMSAVVVTIIVLCINNNGIDSSIQAFSIGGKQTPKAGTFEKDASIEQGKPLQLYGRYDPKKLESATIRFVKPDGKEAFTSGAFKLSDEGTFSLTMNTKSLQPGDYTVQVNGKENKVLISGSLKLTEEKK